VPQKLDIVLALNSGLFGIFCFLKGKIMTANTSSLKDVQVMLEGRGVRDVKFLFNSDLQSRLPSTVQAQASFLLSAYLDGKVSPRDPVGDLSHIA